MYARSLAGSMHPPSAFGRLDVLVLDTSITIDGPAADTEGEAIDHNFELHI